MATEETRLERARMLLALLSCSSGSSASGSASAKLLRALFGLPGILASLGLAPDSLPADRQDSSEAVLRTSTLLSYKHAVEHSPRHVQFDLSARRQYPDIQGRSDSHDCHLSTALPAAMLRRRPRHLQHAVRLAWMPYFCLRQRRWWLYGVPEWAWALQNTQRSSLALQSPTGTYPSNNIIQDVC